jgi:hypothetical protein
LYATDQAYYWHSATIWKALIEFRSIPKVIFTIKSHQLGRSKLFFLRICQVVTFKEKQLNQQIELQETFQHFELACPFFPSPFSFESIP